MRQHKKGFTLIEVLISISLLSLVLLALYKSAEVLRASNKNLFKHLDHASDGLKGSKTLYMDLLQADSNITINSEKKFHRLEISKTKNSLHGLGQAKVTWLVHKENNTLLRIEGSQYKLPLKMEENVEIDSIISNVELFKLYRSKKRKTLLVLIQSSGQEIQSFLIQNISKLPIPLVSPGNLGRTHRTSRKSPSNTPQPKTTP
jgi:prepilin-type N-terminal cleavage/methylation domain-containing protein